MLAQQTRQVASQYWEVAGEGGPHASRFHQSRMAHTEVFTRPSWCCLHLSSFFPTVGNAAGNLALPVLTMRQARENYWEKGKHVEEPEPQPTTVCPTCGGLKEVWVDCDACDGKGEGADGYTCGKCLGHGGWYQKCATCGGTGRILLKRA